MAPSFATLFVARQSPFASCPFASQPLRIKLPFGVLQFDRTAVRSVIRSIESIPRARSPDKGVASRGSDIFRDTSNRCLGYGKKDARVLLSSEHLGTKRHGCPGSAQVGTAQAKGQQEDQQMEEIDMNETSNGSAAMPDAPRPKGKPGRKPKGTVPPVILETPDKPDPDHVLTWRQRKVLQVIRDSVQKRGYPPSMREIGEAVGLTSTSSVSYQLSTLQRKGYLHRDVGRPRTVEVRLPGHPAIRPEQAANGTAAAPEGEVSADGMDIASQEATYVPLVGRIAAGVPITAEQQVEDIF